MKIVGCNLSELKRGTQIAYVPNHAGELLNHLDVERGFVTSTNDKFAFCRYWSKYGNKDHLRTTANSEATPPDRLVIDKSRSQELIDEMLKKYC